MLVSVRVAIVGSRAFPELERVREYVRALPKGTIVVSGGARGVDLAAELEAKRCGLNVCIYYPRWDLHGKGAGFARNRLIVHNCDRLVAFHDGKSRGTLHTISVAVELGVPYRVVVAGTRLAPSSRTKPGSL